MARRTGYDKAEQAFRDSLARIELRKAGTDPALAGLYNLNAGLALLASALKADLEELSGRLSDVESVVRSLRR